MDAGKLFLLICLAVSVGACQSPQPTDESSPTEPTPEEGAEEGEATNVEGLGAVAFDTSCNDEAQQHFDRGLAQLHHMWYQKARKSFQETASADKKCAMAQWGIAMTYYTPLWAPPIAEDLAAGSEAAERAVELDPPTDREERFVAAIAAFYANYEDRKHPERVKSFLDGWKQAFEADPDDLEARSFYALAMLATVPPMTESTEKQERAGTILEDVLDREPLHPGGHHYLIHAYDHPKLAEQAVEVARSYREIAPSVPHALHMPTHIFTRLGMWDGVITWNLDSAEAAEANPVNGHSSLHFHHAIDYLTHAYLQKAQDEKADAVAERSSKANKPQVHPAVGYASAAIPARIALEKRDWAAAAKVEPIHTTQLPWKKWPFLKAITHAARGVGAAKENDLEAARAEVRILEELLAKSEALEQPYWTNQVELYRDVIDALIMEAEGKTDRALEQLRAATETQASMPKHPFSPGRIILASHFLGDLLCAQDRHEDGLTVYEAQLERSPNRLQTLYGAAVAARDSGQTQAAKEYFEQIVELTEDGNQDRPSVQEAKSFLDGV